MASPCSEPCQATLPGLEPGPSSDGVSPTDKVDSRVVPGATRPASPRVDYTAGPHCRCGPGGRVDHLPVYKGSVDCLACHPRVYSGSTYPREAARRARAFPAIGIPASQPDAKLSEVGRTGVRRPARRCQQIVPLAPFELKPSVPSLPACRRRFVLMRRPSSTLKRRCRCLKPSGQPQRPAPSCPNVPQPKRRVRCSRWFRSPAPRPKHLERYILPPRSAASQGPGSAFPAPSVPWDGQREWPSSGRRAVLVEGISAIPIVKYICPRLLKKPQITRRRRFAGGAPWGLGTPWRRLASASPAAELRPASAAPRQAAPAGTSARRQGPCSATDRKPPALARLGRRGWTDVEAPRPQAPPASCGT
jgi:hypothetical protein